MADDMTAHFRMLAEYNRRANDRVYDACATLPPTSLSEPSAAPYSTILGLLEHLLASDDVWLSRFEGDVQAQLNDDHPERGLDELRAARLAMDERLEAFTNSLTPQRLGETFRYRNSRGEQLAVPIQLLINHMFNHQTHHRGQLQVLLRRAGAMGVSLDLARLMGLPNGGRR